MARKASLRFMVWGGTAMLVLGLTGQSEPSWAASTKAEFALHISYEIDNEMMREVVKRFRRVCVELKQGNLDLKRDAPEMWKAVEPAYKETNPNFSIERATAPAPIWSKIGKGKKEEYFFGDKYALYTYSALYDIEDDGSCAVTTKRTAEADLDNGRLRHRIDLETREGTKYISRSITRRQLNKQAKKTIMEVPQAAEAIKFLADGMSRLAEVGQFGGQDGAAGEACDVFTLGKGEFGSTCYWSNMRYYPGILERPIILRTVVKGDEDQKMVDKAVVFRKLKHIDAKIFEPPAGISLQDKTHNSW